MKALTTPEAVAELRHELRTPLNLIIGYSEMLLEDAETDDRRAALERVLAAGRDLLDRINSAVPPSRSEITSGEFEVLRMSLREPQERILAATAELLPSEGEAADPEFERDVRRVRGAAERVMTVELPQGRGSSHVAITVEHPAFGERVAALGGQPARILVVDDQDDNRAVLERRLRRQGHEVECAGGGFAALAQLQGGASFDLVMLDVLMPDLDGLAVLERLKADPATRDIPVIMISALDDVASVVRCIERGAEDHLPKPFDPVLLRARIGACLEKKRLRDIELEYLRAVGRVTQAASAVEAGTYTSGDLGEVAHRGDELGRLARVFDTMADHVRARESRLKEQVEALRREIADATAARTDEPSEGPTLPSGAVFADRYEVQGELGSGAMGMVYRAHDRELNELVAIKTLRSELLSDPSVVTRFKSEIRLARHISSKHVVRTHDIGERDGVYYLTMEYVEGITLRSLLDTRGRLGVAPTLAIAAQLAQSLAAAHEQGVVHRDIKPQNLLVDANGVLKVMDFGVARLQGNRTQMTEAGMLVGTPAYMAPEQLLSEDFDERADLFAMGVVLFECLTGRLPFAGTTIVSIIAHLMRDEAPSPSSLNADVPADVSDLVLRLLAKEPGGRPATAAEVARQLAALG
jgi:CheY-like chemotaxis protein